MAKQLPDRPICNRVEQRGPFALVVSTYHSEFTGPLAAAAIAEFAEIDSTILTATFEVPGSFEIPVVVRHLAGAGRFRAILAMGVIFEGETAHAQLIAASVSDALQRVAVDSGVPVLHEVLLLKDEEQARARCLDSRINRGIEAARAAVRIAGVVADAGRS